MRERDNRGGEEELRRAGEEGRKGSRRGREVR